MNLIKNLINGRYLIGSGMLLLLVVASLRAEENIKVETINARSGSIDSAQLKEMDAKLYVSGRIRLNQPYQASPSLHVDVYLMGKNGDVLQKQKSRILVTSQKRDRTNGGRFPYAVSFDEGLASKASVVRVVYCQDTHPERET